jgi:hypothetical protein
VVCIHNQLTRWKLHFATPKEERENKTDYSGLFTSTKSGQNEYGTWSEEGLTQFIKYREMNKLARKDPNTARIEQDCLASLRKKKGIVGKDASEQARMKEAQKRARKRGAGEEPVARAKKIIRTVEDDVDSDNDDEFVGSEED